jgi:hypothetical protein
VPIDVLPDDILLEIFDSYREDISRASPVESAWGWQTLAQVSRRWRAIVLASPQRLHLRVVCDPRTPVRASLDIWPPFPIAVICFPFHTVDEEGEANMIAALQHRDRVSDIHIFDETGFAVQRLAAEMQEPFPALTDIYLGSFFYLPPVLPDAFLGGSAPRLRSFTLQHVEFPAFSRFVLNATHIVTLRLSDIPNYGYFSLSPDAMAACLAALPELELLSIVFRSPPSSPLQMAVTPPMRVVLPSLTQFRFRGVSEYMEDIISRIDTPQLNQLSIGLFMDLIFDIPQLHMFIGRSGKLMPLDEARLLFDDVMIKLILGSPTRFELEIRCEEPGWQLSSMAEICNKHLPFLSKVDQLNICGSSRIQPERKDEVDSSQWLELFRPFSAVRVLYVFRRLESVVAAALLELKGERTMEVLPELQSLCLDELEPSGSAQDVMQPFVSARQLSDHPIVVQRRKRQFQREIYPRFSFE